MPVYFLALYVRLQDSTRPHVSRPAPSAETSQFLNICWAECNLTLACLLRGSSCFNVHVR